MYYLKKITLVFLFSWFIQSCQDNSVGNAQNAFPEAEKQNIDSRQLVQAYDEAAQISGLQGLAVARNSVIVAERYYNDASAEPDPDLHVMSVTKSITSALVGIAIAQGYLQSLDQTVGEFLGAEVEALNAELNAVTIHQLLTMSAGQNWKELGPVSEYGNFVSAPDQLEYIFQKPVINTPGTIFNYSDGTAHLVSAILARATGISPKAFADEFLFEPLGIGPRTWYTDNRNIPYGGVRLFIGIHDMIRIGFLYANDGYFNGKQVIPADWIQRSTSFKITTNNVIPFLSDYGYFWWLGSAHGHEFFCANGYGGQFIFVVKSLNLVVCSRSDYRQNADENWYRILDTILNRILPAVRK